jgi:glutathione synthase
MNLVMHKIAHDPVFMDSSLADTVRVDEFTSRMLTMHHDAERIGKAQPLNLGLFRTDYMVNESDNSMRQVESNAISSGFAILGSRITRMHRYIAKKYCPNMLPFLPDNESDVNFPISFIEAFKAYGNPSAVILFVVEDRTTNVCDQRGHDHKISEMSNIRVIRKSFTELHDIVRVTEDRRLMIDKDTEVGLVYYRYCYDPSQYPKGDESWDLRLKIETSKAIKCPSISYHLSGVKKFQQILTDMDVLNRFLPHAEAAELYSTFTGLWGLEQNDSGNQAVAMALRDPEYFVLKPQREGGGHNIYGSDIVPTLTQLRDKQEREGYILMQMIRPPVYNNYILRADFPADVSSPDPVVSELGIFGSILASDAGVIFNREDGHVLRSKRLGVNEGGINAGYGAMDSPLLS